MRSYLFFRLGALICLIILSFSSLKVNAQTYCTPTYFQGCTLSAEINDFTLNGDGGSAISDLATGCSTVGSFPPVTSYRDMHATMTVSLSVAASYTVTSTTTLLSVTPTGLQIFIDFNDDGIFDPFSESVGGGAYAVIGSTNFTITIPGAPPTGAHRLRAVASGDLTYPSIIPCPYYSLTGGTSLTGEVHDYTVIIGSGSTSSCGVPTSLAATGVTSTSAILNWAEPAGSVGSEYVVTTTAGTPSGSGTQTTALTYTPTGLTPSTVYYAYVRDSCGPGNFSAWVNTTFTTTATSSCGLPTGLSATSVTSTSAVLNWAEPSGSSGSEYVVTTTPGTPVGSGTQTSALTYSATGLTPSTVYYASVLDSCGVGDLSAWVTITFTTTPTTGVKGPSNDFSITTFPNPVKEMLSVKISGTISEKGYVELMDISGKMIKTIIADANVININTDDIPAGIYLLRYTDAKHAQTIRVSKQ